MSQMVKYFDDLKIGEEFISPGRTVTETDVVMFSALTGDYNPLHTNVEFAKTTVFGERIAHGLLGLSIVSGLVTRLGVFDGSVLAFLGLQWKFTAPILLGDTVHFRMTIIDKKETSKPDRGVVVRKVELLNQHGKVVQEGTMDVMMKRQ